MADPPLVSVITPAWHRHKLLTGRCIPSVQAQAYPRVEHVIVSDGPDPELAALFRSKLPFTQVQDIRQGRKFPVWYYQLPGHDPAEHWGHHARLAGLEYAAGDLITYCDDDDALRPEHCELLAAALEADPEAGFAVSRMMAHSPVAHDTVIGWGPLAAGNVGSPMIMHRRSALEHGTWGPASWIEDWELVARWLDAGIRYVNVDAETADIWPSSYRQETR